MCAGRAFIPSMDWGSSSSWWEAPFSSPSLLSKGLPRLLHAVVRIAGPYPPPRPVHAEVLPPLGCVPQLHVRQTEQSCVLQKQNGIGTIMCLVQLLTPPPLLLPFSPVSSLFSRQAPSPLSCGCICEEAIKTVPHCSLPRYMTCNTAS